MSTMKRPLQDPHGRTIRKLRVSLTDVCNFRCFYCMPVDAKFMPRQDLLTPVEIGDLCRKLVRLGIEQIRITGGEPTMRPEFRDIVRRLADLPVKKLGLTSNGMHLESHLEFLREVGCRHLNISLDSLDKANFNRITRSQAFDRVYRSIMLAREMDFNVKINMVAMRGENHHEIPDFVRFSARTGIEVRFLELMKIGQACGPSRDLFIAADEMMDVIRQEHELQPVQVDFDSTSFNFTTPGGAALGFIASESKPFCGSCSRWRLNADGFLQACLMSGEGVNIRKEPLEVVDGKLIRVLAMKPGGRLEKTGRDMYRMGG